MRLLSSVSLVNKMKHLVACVINAKVLTTFVSVQRFLLFVCWVAEFESILHRRFVHIINFLDLSFLVKSVNSSLVILKEM